MAKIENSNTKYNLNNSDNYNNYLTCNLKEIIDNYIYILLNYILLFNEKINKNDSSDIIFFIFKKGICTINHIFLFILYYTKNLEVTFYHLQNSYIFYIEFIEQINFNSSNSIKISVNDAISFVYKKNIYNVNNSINNITEQEKKIFLQIEEIIKIYDGIINIFISHSQSQQNTFNLIELKNVIENFQEIIYPKIKSKNIINFNFMSLHIINSIQHFINLLYVINIPFVKKKELLFSFINEINSRKNIINFNSLTNNIQLFNFNDIDEDYDSSQIIPTMFSH
jgi:hypothetical protein